MCGIPTTARGAAPWVGGGLMQQRAGRRGGYVGAAPARLNRKTVPRGAAARGQRNGLAVQPRARRRQRRRAARPAATRQARCSTRGRAVDRTSATEPVGLMLASAAAPHAPRVHPRPSRRGAASAASARLGRPTGEDRTCGRVAWAERATTTTRATGRGEAAGAAFARAHGHIPLSARCERRDGGVGGWVGCPKTHPRIR